MAKGKQRAVIRGVPAQDRAEDAGSRARQAAHPVIPRDTVVPVERTQTVYTIAPDQEAAELRIVQGERARMSGNAELGVVRVEPLPPGPAGAPVEVTFRVDLSGVLHVRALHVPSGVSADIHIAESPYRLTEQVRKSVGAEVAALRADAPAAAQGTERERSLARAGDARAGVACAREGRWR